MRRDTPKVNTVWTLTKQQFQAKSRRGVTCFTHQRAPLLVNPVLEDHAMKRVIQSTLMLSLLLAPVPALAQADTTTTGTTTTATTSDDGFDWGWLGLLGLLGLAGLRRRDDRPYPAGTTHTTGTGPR